MSVKDFGKSYSRMLSEAAADKTIMGIVLAGSRARNMQNLYSDCDIYMILQDSTAAGRVSNLRNLYETKYCEVLKLDLSNQAIQTVTAFQHYAELGSPYFYDRYNLVRAKAELDKTEGLIVERLRSFERLAPEEQKAIIEQNLAEYINLVYRSVRSYQSGRITASRLDTAESVRYLLHLLFAFAGRVRPYNKYLEWELDFHPLDLIPWQKGPFFAMLSQLAERGDIGIQKLIYVEIERLARRQGFAYVYNAWGIESKLSYICRVGP